MINIKTMKVVIEYVSNLLIRNMNMNFYNL